jgi:GT2 family glycosyltransferase
LIEQDVIITSYNRPSKVIELAKVIFKESGIIPIVVDSGGNDYSGLSFIQAVYSSHKNQPYQRYLGYLVSKKEWLLFLDDDMEPLEDSFEKIVELMHSHSDKGLVGLNFKNAHQETFLNKSPKTVLIGLNHFKFVKFLRRLSGYPILESGMYFKNGVKGHLPNESGRTEHASGGAFLAQRKYLYQNFNMQLFDLYDHRMGKGEDGILSYTVSKTKPLYYCAEQLFWHNDQGNSVYTQNHFLFNKIVAFSRAYLNLEYYRLNNLNLSVARWNYFNYSFWRFMGLLTNCMLKPSRTRWVSLKGNFFGWKSGMTLKFDAKLSRNAIWHQRALKDIDG